jgi:hypothetical protein
VPSLTALEKRVHVTDSNLSPPRTITSLPSDLVIAEISNTAWKFVIFDRMAAESAAAAVRKIVKAFEELVPVSVLRDRAFAIAVELRHPAYDCFYLALAERSTSRLVGRRTTSVCRHTLSKARAIALMDESFPQCFPRRAIAPTASAHGLSTSSPISAAERVANERRCPSALRTSPLKGSSVRGRLPQVANS